VVTVVEGTVVVKQGGTMDVTSPRLSEVDGDPQSSTTQESLRDLSVGLRLTAGKQVVVKRNAAEEPKKVNVAAATAWTRRELVFEFTPLAQVADEFNRYNERRLIVEGERLRAFKITAMFRSTDSGSLIHYLESMPGVRVEQNDETVVIASSTP
jgi:ferric-dicitrate binding protein FerR (iron transport regulator)